MTTVAVAVLGRGLVDPDTPLLRADDLGVLRGDGVFESLHVRQGKPWMIDEHLARMARSAARLELDLPDEGALRDLLYTACATADPATEYALRLVCTRGPDGSGEVTCFATLATIAETTIAPRTTGISVRTITLGYAAGGRTGNPWLLGGVKSLSYAVNMASQRWALAQGVDDVLWVSSDGYVLEAPTSTVVWLAGDRLFTVPAEQTGILPGTTARYLLDHAADLGYTAGEAMITLRGLASASGVWLLSSIRGIAELRTVDGVDRPASPATPRLRAFLGF
jgi:4-amino-4-deoxychorismate lyase